MKSLRSVYLEYTKGSDILVTNTSRTQNRRCLFRRSNMVIGETQHKQNERFFGNVVVSYIANRTALLCKSRSYEVFIFEVCSVINFNEMYMVLEGTKEV